MALRYGKRAPKNGPALAAGRFLTGSVPHPASQDNLARLSHWQMLGNDSAGDCVAVTWANVRRLVSAFLGGREVYPSQDWVWAVYKTQNPGFDPNGDPNVNGPGSSHDQGMDIQSLLEHLANVGGPDGVKAVAFAKVDHNNLDQVKAAISVFGYVWVGLQVTAANQDEFSVGQPWDYVPGSPVDGGHSVISGGYLGDPAQDAMIVTWAEETGFTDALWAHQVDECWVVIWPEHLGSKEFQAGVDLAALAADYKALTGKTLPVPVPPPAPVPGPTPVPPTPTPTPVPPAPTPVPVTDPDQVLAAAAHVYLSRRHYGSCKVIATALKKWLAAKGL